MKKHLCFLLCFVLAFSMCCCSSSAPKKDKKNFQYTMTKGINLSALESNFKPHAFLYYEDTYSDIAKKGFDHIRLPVDFRNYSNKNGVIENDFYNKLDDIITKATDSGLMVMLDFHGWFDFNVSKGDDKLFLNIWKNLAEHYKDYSNALIFELINEPHTTEGGDLDAENLMNLQSEAIKQIRTIDPERTIVIATPEWNGPWTLKDLQMPDFDNLIVAIHTYEPLDFTHQGQSWMNTEDVHIELSQQILDGLIQQLNLITEFKERTGCRVVLNEFGLTTTGHISDDDVYNYLSCITKYAKEHDIPWTYWSYLGDFGIFDSGFLGLGGDWRENVLNALLT